MAVDMTETVILDDISIMVPYPKQNTDAAGYLYAFSYLVCNNSISWIFQKNLFDK